MATKKHERPAYFRVYSKVEALVRELQDASKGIPLRTQKHLLSTVTGVFQASDLVSWLMRRLGIEDRTEAATIAAVVCKWGYVFPVENSNSALKDDSSWMRNQSQYFWPSQNWDPDNTDYAIYLAKRNMRSKARHSLSDHEAETYSQLQHMLSGRWDQVSEQAKAQLCQLRSHKRKDKEMFDSQERAFWRVHRPPPGSLKVMELSKMKMAITAREPIGNRFFSRGKEDAEIAYYRSALLLTTVSPARQCESLIAYSQNYLSYDPCFTAPSPSNPWITDDTDLWTLECVRLDCVDKKRASRWGFGLYVMLSDDTGQHAFAQFLDKEFSAENLKFWKDCQEFKALPASEIPLEAERIFKDYFAFDSPSTVNVDSQTLDTIRAALRTPARYMFDAAETHIYRLMEKGPYVRYLQSDDYKRLLQQNPSPPKKGFLSIPALPSFMTRSGSPKPRRSPRSSPANTPPVTPPVYRKHTQSLSGDDDDFVMQLVAGASTNRRDSSKSAPGHISPQSPLPMQVINAMTEQGLGRRSSPTASERSLLSVPSRGTSPAQRSSSLPPGVELQKDGETV